MKGPALVVMARAPVAGKVKTRLQPDLTAEQSASVSLAFVLDTISLAVSLSQFTVFLAYTPRNARRLFKEIIPAGTKLIPQTGRNIGQRMYNLMRYLEDRGYSPVVIIGSDVPTLQPATLIRAVEELKKCDLCLGPSTDGGYYLVGACHANEHVFNDIPWSTPDVLAATMSKVSEAGQSMTLLDVYSDVDTFVDLKRLSERIERLRVKGGCVPVNTKAWLTEAGYDLA